MKYGKLTIIETYMEKGRRKAKCICECGKEKTVQMTHLKSGATTSCGCYQKELMKEKLTTHNGKGTSLYNRWKALRQRCNNPKNARYEDYGARGIKFCEEWDSFENFRKWSYENGYKEKLVLDRIDNNKGYNPRNCRWCTVRENNDNRRTTVKVEGLTLRAISEKYNIPYSRVHTIYYKNKPTTIKQILIYANQLPTSEGIR